MPEPLLQFIRTSDQNRFRLRCAPYIQVLEDVDEASGVQVGMTTAADGQSERTNQTVEVALRCFLGGDTEPYSRWSDYLPILEHETNSTTNSFTGFPLNELRFTVQPRGLADLFYPIEGASESAERLAEDLKNRQNEVRDSISIAQWKQKRSFDGKRQNKEFSVGDLVVLKFNRFGPGYKPPKPHDHKLAPIGTPLRIAIKVSPLSYCLALPEGTRFTTSSRSSFSDRTRDPGKEFAPYP